ncbi:MAG: CoA transferase [Myxococcota bacterium]|jgi:crotonobetainyl-CoA:carnitine CoA-transferase CaiB-like acyl-CoA transferase|nr:CoA transferase [Myxococcota bacterium]
METKEPSSAAGTGPLAGLRVLELGAGVAAPYCAKLLADLGADVIKLEDPNGGDPTRFRGPVIDGELDPERSGSFLYLNTSKRSACIDLVAEEGREAFAALASLADVVIEDRNPGELGRLGLGYEVLATRNPGLILTSITPFGQTGPNAQHVSEHLNLFHAGGHASPFTLMGAGDRAAARAGGYLGEYDAGLTAALGTLGAVYGRLETGRGEHVDCSKQEAMMCLERVTIGRFANEDDPFGASRGPGGLSKAKDGWVMLTTLEKHQWEGLVRAMGNPEWAQADWCATPQGRMERFDEVEKRKNAWGETLMREEIYHAAQAEGTPAAPVRSVAEVLEWRQPRARGFFADIDHPRAGTLQVPTAAFKFSKTPWVGRRAPMLGEHTEEVLEEARKASRSPRPAAAASGSAAPLGARRPLEGIRIVDFTWAWAGPQGALLLGMLGAEVIKVESRARLDHARVHSLTAGSMQGGIDESPVFNDLNLGKRSVTLNLRSEGGREIVKQLVSRSDVVLQNMRPGVLDKLGLGYDDLSEVRPDIIMLSSSAVGATGPEGRYAGYAPTFACLSGITSISGHADEPPIALSGSVDLRVGTMSAFAVLAALHHRKRTGEGQDIDLSSTETMSAMMGHTFLDYQLSGVVPERMGNRDEFMAPHGCYRCVSDGDVASWVTIAVANDAQWRALCGVVGDAALEGDDFATAAARKENEHALDGRLEAWTQDRTAEAVVDELQKAGVAAALVQSGASLADDPHLAARGAYVPITHPHLGTLRSVRPPWRLRGASIDEPAPLLGQHNDYVLGEILGLSNDEIARLEEEQSVY